MEREREGKRFVDRIVGVGKIYDPFDPYLIIGELILFPIVIYPDFGSCLVGVDGPM